MRGEPSAKANQSPTHGWDDRPAAQGFNLVQNVSFAVLGLDNGVWFSLRNAINFPSFFQTEPERDSWIFQTIQPRPVQI